MKKLYTLLAIALFYTTGLAQIKKSGNMVTVQPQFKTDTPYNYQLTMKKLVQDGEEVNVEIEQHIPIKLTLYSEGEGFNLFEWESQPMLFFKNNDEGKTYTFPTENVKINYRTDENYVLGEVSNYDEVIQDYAAAYQKIYEDETTNYEDLASKSSLYFVQMFHMFFGQEFSSKDKEQMMNLFFNPMKNTFTAVEDEIVYAEIDGKSSFNFTQKYSTEMEDNSVKMMNHKTIDSYRSKQTGSDYEMKAWGNQTFEPTGLVNQIERVVQVKQNGKIIQFVYTLTQN
ncbi:hypothetical protein [Faecalibacter macacae]|uniref:Uncharacterized protein n=1 Tax=Faecalibacter macacae TaxID=1859289 RepID=A0A3L9M0C8_9FLAO|nr:hypothetical protein [Faecalibacter macacae]RLZ06610.1 hypothetical protein EAH69_13015 [Faecalibacter macacae]